MLPFRSPPPPLYLLTFFFSNLCPGFSPILYIFQEKNATYLARLSANPSRLIHFRLESQYLSVCSYQRFLLSLIVITLISATLCSVDMGVALKFQRLDSQVIGSQTGRPYLCLTRARKLKIRRYREVARGLRNNIAVALPNTCLFNESLY